MQIITHETIHDVRADFLARRAVANKPSVVDRVSFALKRFVFWLLAKFIGVDNTNRQHSKAPSHICILRYSSIGDYLVMTPFIRTISAMWPECKISVVASERNAPMIAIDSRVHHVHEVGSNASLRELITATKGFFAATKPDVLAALVFTKKTKAAIVSLFARTARSRMAIGIEGRQEAYSQVFDVLPEHADGEHWFETFERAGSALGANVSETPKPYFAVTQSDLETASSRARNANRSFMLSAEFDVGINVNAELFTSGSSYIVVNVSGSEERRSFPESTAVALCTEILRSDAQCHCVVIGSPAQHAIVAGVVATMSDSRCYAEYGSFHEVGLVIAGARLLVTPDTAVVHVASIARVPVFSVCERLENVLEWGPYNVPFTSIVSHSPQTVSEVNPLTVCKELTAFLQSESLSMSAQTGAR